MISWNTLPSIIAVKQASTLEDLVVDTLTHTIYHIEYRPQENGRSVVVMSRRNQALIDAPWDARTRAHEFGGGAVFAYNDHVFFSDYASSQVHVVREGANPTPITADPVYRYADLNVYPPQPEYLVAVREDHSSRTIISTETTIIWLNTLSPAETILISGPDFLSSPRFSPDGSKLAWMQWSHPHMPWDGTELYISHVEFSAGQITLHHQVKLFGHEGTISVAQPRWLNENHLVFLEDSSGYYNPNICDLCDTHSPRFISVLPKPLREDFCLPDWYFGQSSYAVLTPSSILFTALSDGRSRFYLANVLEDTPIKVTTTILESPFVDVRSLHPVSSGEVVFIGRTDIQSDSLISMKNFPSKTQFELLKRSSKSPAKGLVSIAKSIQLQILDHSNRPLFLFLYPPINPRYHGPKNELPPAIFHLHGGPTFRQPAGFNWERQFFTSRGWAWVDINYTGSSGYGRSYRTNLTGKWGITDVEDCFEAATQLQAQGLIDGKRVAIRGISAGGFTALSTLIAHPDAFAAATSIYGGVDMFRLQLSGSSHKFTSRYFEGLIGGTVQDDPTLFQERSPLFHADRIKTPLLVLQGSLDTVVPVSQAESLVQVLRAGGTQVDYRVFDGEGHGWRNDSTIRDALESELSFYRRVVLGIEEAGAEQ